MTSWCGLAGLHAATRIIWKNLRFAGILVLETLALRKKKKRPPKNVQSLGPHGCRENPAPKPSDFNFLRALNGPIIRAPWSSYDFVGSSHWEHHTSYTTGLVKTRRSRRKRSGGDAGRGLRTCWLGAIARAVAQLLSFDFASRRSGGAASEAAPRPRTKPGRNAPTFRTPGPQALRIGEGPRNCEG